MLSEEDDIRNYTEKQLLEIALKDWFKKDKMKWPSARWAVLINLLFDEVKIVFQHDTQEILSRLQRDLSEYGSLAYFNLR